MLVQNNGDAPDATPPQHQNSGALAHCAALLLSGGDGKRLQELTSEVTGSPIPKQYCRLLHGSSLLEAAVARAKLLFPPERIHVVINENHLDLARDHVHSLPESNIFVQPLNRDTKPEIDVPAADAGAGLWGRDRRRFSYGPLHRQRLHLCRPCDARGERDRPYAR